MTETQIRERAYQLWQADPEVSAEAHWEAAIQELKQERSLWGRLGKSWHTAFSPENRNFSLDVLKFIVSSFGVLATVFAGVGLYLTYRTGQAQLDAAQQERQLNNERLVTDRFSKAVEQLGSPDIDVRIGAIYSLERIAKDSSKDHWTIMEVLTAFVRNKSPLPKDWKPNSKRKLSAITTDVQSALTVIGRRKRESDPAQQRLDLSKTNLQGAHLQDANFEGVFLKGADLSAANLLGANFSNAHLQDANLLGANFEGANFEGAFLKGADLRYANLRYANLEDAHLKGAHGMTTEQVKAAQKWQSAYYDSEFRQQLELPSEKPKP